MTIVQRGHEFGHLDIHYQQVEESKKSSDATSKPQYFALKCLGVHVEDVDGDHISLCLLEPTSSGGTWNAVTHCEIEITGGLNQFSEAMVGLLLLTVFV